LAAEGIVVEDDEFTAVGFDLGLYLRQEAVWPDGRQGF
jgi:hypothetical protein